MGARRDGSQRSRRHGALTQRGRAARNRRLIGAGGTLLALTMVGLTYPPKGRHPPRAVAESDWVLMGWMHPPDGIEVCQAGDVA